MNGKRVVSREAPDTRFARRGIGFSRGGRAVRILALAALFLGLAACGGARHRKVNGPPPEYELPDESGGVDGGPAGSAPADLTPPGTSGGAAGTRAGVAGTSGGAAGSDGGVTPSTGGAR